MRYATLYKKQYAVCKIKPRNPRKDEIVSPLPFIYRICVFKPLRKGKNLLVNVVCKHQKYKQNRRHKKQIP